MAKKKNTGKIFEVNFKDSVPQHMWSYRPPDSGGGVMARFTSESLCDLFLFDNLKGKLYLLELKSTIGTSISFKSYEFCMRYEKIVKNFEDWNSTLTSKERKEYLDTIKEKRAEIKKLKKETNGAMIKYHQIKSLKEIENENINMNCFLVLSYLEKEKTYLVPINTFWEFWKNTTKKSINENDLDELIESDLVQLIEQEKIGRSQINSEYNIEKCFS